MPMNLGNDGVVDVAGEAFMFTEWELRSTHKEAGGQRVMCMSESRKFRWLGIVTEKILPQIRLLLSFPF